MPITLTNKARWRDRPGFGEKAAKPRKPMKSGSHAMRDQDLPPLTTMDGGRFSRPAIRARLRALAEARRVRAHPALA
jgi:hypothetical protein